MYNITRSIQIYFMFIIITQLFQVCVIECEFEETNDNSSTSPSIEIKLSPPENPLPEISEQIQKAEVTREEIEDGLITKLKDTFNQKLVESHDKIKNCVEQNFQDFVKSKKFKMIMNDLNHKRSFNSNANENHPSFLQISNYNTKSDIVPSSVRIMMEDTETLDPIVNQKIKQIEELRNDSEIQLFDRAKNEFDELLEITLTELDKNIKIQLDVLFTNATHNGKHVNVLRDINKTNLEESTSSILSKAKSISKKSSKLFKEGMKLFSPSFLQISSSNIQQKLLNVKIGQPDKPYPTVDDLVMNMEKRRDASEKDIRNKILNIEMKYIKAHHEMAKDALHTVTARLLSQLGKVPHNSDIY
ncbi:blood stage antigen 41-3 precursor [Babesia microti strain RI]|uniref:Blood stage antigen 41-3 n=1 Tax=Babesia microti (strain RI) TaxID=1133968 RepID=A0A1R4AAA6_BABMR|nr:blood stage antigen 41-3 precursor [Babesia microti strain RI]SJK85907.1 blood stage antigen 41-3 precursor [Babesia microti strain RI]|eukprot:XP_021338116.1 blood stage antigen 41-3 precursor [Babesia microti strain RI]